MPDVPPKRTEIPSFSPQTGVYAPCAATGAEDQEINKRTPKLVLHTLQPLYNSLERTLAIFRKTGRKAILASEQTENGLVITIHIPNA